jgi:UDP-N-acetylglucosamine acyltransferase
MIHPTAIIDPAAELEAKVEVGPYAIIGPGVRIGRGTRIGPHVVLRGPTRIGRDNQIYQFASVGEAPQDKKYAGEETFLEIGDRNVVREFVTLHRGTIQDLGVTRIGSDNLFMAYVHVAHDCQVGDNVIMANAVTLAGHVKVEDWAILGGFTIIHQFCRIGAHCFSGGGSVVSQDIPPFVLVNGHPARPRGINSEGLRRRDFSPAAISAIKQGYRLLYKSRQRLEEALVAMRALGSPDVDRLADFVANSPRGFVR